MARPAIALSALTLTIFGSAFLLFLLQPMFSRMVLPLMGGGAAVWNTCVLFFQLALLAGYLYAHVATQRLARRWQIGLHLTLLVVSLALLPIRLRLGAPPAEAEPVGWLLLLLTLSIAAPFFLLSTTSPLLQRWLASSRHPAAADPYFLYAASNAGSLLALLAYPVAVEPWLTLAEQRTWWSIGYAGFVGLVGVTAWAVAAGAAGKREGGSAGDKGAFTPEAAKRPTGAEGMEDGTGISVGPGASAPVAELTPARGLRGDSHALDASGLALSRAPAPPLILLAAIPSAMMLAVTTWITTDIAPVPLLWVIPLALYLLSFVLVFARRPRPPHATWVRLLPLVLVAATVLLFWGDRAVAPGFAPFHLLAFFLTALVCHGELARRRPPPAELTRFYLWLSVGGAVGGAFSALLAPLLFDSIAEYPWLVVAGCLVAGMAAKERESGRVGENGAVTPEAAEKGAVTPERAERATGAEALGPAYAGSAVLPRYVSAPVAESTPGRGLRGDSRAWVPLAVSILALTVAGSHLVGTAQEATRGPWWEVGVIGACGVAALALFAWRTRPLHFAAGAALILAAGRGVERARDNTVFSDRNFYGERSIRAVGPALTLAHGTTMHGMQFTDSARRREPLAYYHRRGPVGEIFRSLPLSPLPLRVAVVGLGTGAIAAYGERGDRIDFYEIDPDMVRLARDGRWFTYLDDSEAEIRVILGDGRIRLAESAEGTYDLILLDAFSSDAVPVHLLTREALAMYLDRLRPEGLLAVHLSNRYLDLKEVVAAAAKELGVPIRHRVRGTLTGEREKGFIGSSWAALAKDTVAFGTLPVTWLPLAPQRGIRVWTDDYSNVLGVFRRR